MLIVLFSADTKYTRVLYCTNIFTYRTKGYISKRETSVSFFCALSTLALGCEQVDEMALYLLEKARKVKMSVTRATASKVLAAPLGQPFWLHPQLLLQISRRSSGVSRSGEVGQELRKAQRIQSNRLHVEVGSVNREVAKEKPDEIKALWAKYPAKFIFNVGETGIQWKLLPRRTYLSSSEDRKAARGSQGIALKDRLSTTTCCNADGTGKVDLAIIRKEKEPHCLKGIACPPPYFSQYVVRYRDVPQVVAGGHPSLCSGLYSDTCAAAGGRLFVSR